jgi:hypothetical protein
VANWMWSALFGAFLIGDWALGSWMLRVRSLSSPPSRWRRVRLGELAVAFIFAGIAVAQFIGR